MTVVFYVSGHGLGHATRDIEVMHALGALDRSVRIVVRTSAPAWVFEHAPTSIEWHDVEVDPGVVERDDLTIDEAATVRAAARFYVDFDRRSDSEAEWLRTVRPDVVVGDIPPLACAAAARAGVASAALGNFTWDWIYEGYNSMDTDAPHVQASVRSGYRCATTALRLPMHGGFAAMTTITDVPFIARRSTQPRGETRRRLGLPDDRVAVLISLNRFRVAVPREAIARSGRFAIVDSTAATLDAHGLQYQDLVAASDVVISKPGYGIASECLANGTALLYTSREGFREYDLLAAAMPSLLRCRHLAQDDLLAGRWAAAIDALLAQPAPAAQPSIDGAFAIARSLANLARKSSESR